jgi:MFS family permease
MTASAAKFNLQRNQGKDSAYPLSAPATASAMEDPSSKNRKKDKKARARRFSVGAILAASFLNLLGFTMAGPITPALGKHFSLNVGASFGSLTSAYPLGMLFGLFLWPSLSDRIGRKPVMAFSLFGSGLGLALQSLVIQANGSLSLFLAIRVLTGSFAGSSPISKAFLADIGFRDGKLPKYLALKDASATGAFIVGPALGGVMYDIRRKMIGGSVVASATKADLINMSGSLSFVIGVSAAASMLASLLVTMFVKEIKPKKKNTEDIDDSSSSSGAEDDGDYEELVPCPLGKAMWEGVASVCLVSFLFNVGDSTFHAFFSQLLKEQANLDAQRIGLVYTLLACVSFSVSTTGAGAILRKLGPVLTCVAGMSCISAGLFGMGTATIGLSAGLSRKLVIASAAIFYCGVPLYGPTIPTMLLRCVPSYQRGFIMGLDGAINTIGRVISPLLIGDIYRRYGAGVAFGSAGVAVFCGALVALIRRCLVLLDPALKATTKVP